MDGRNVNGCGKTREGSTNLAAQNYRSTPGAWRCSCHDPPRFSVKRSISPAIHVTTIFAGDFLGRLPVVALEILADCQLRAEAREFLKRVVAKRRAQAQKCYGDQKAC